MPFRADAVAHPIIGRAPHLRRLDRLATGLRGGRGGVTVLTGEPGIGKSALLTRLLGRARDVTILATSGLESETSLPFAALGDLLRPLLPRLANLPGPQADALGAALTLTRPDGPAAPYAVCMATLTMLTAAADRQPVLVVVDDAGWIDHPSLAALLFAARRIENDAVAMVFAARDPVPPEFLAAGVEVLHLDGLSLAAGGDLLEVLRPGRVDPEVRTGLWSATGGNPLALTQLCGVLTDDQLAGAVALPDPLPLGAGLRDAFAARLAPLPQETRTALLTVALSATPDVGTLTAALDTVGVGSQALAAATCAELLAYRGTRVTLTHPLLRAAVRHAATPVDRRRVYDALAATSEGETRAWYRAAELTGTDEAAANELENAADGMRRRAGFAAAARAMHRAAELTGDRGTRVRRLVVAANDAQVCGHLPEASSWLGEALPAAEDPALRADVALAYGWVLNRCGAPATAQQVLSRAARQVLATDPHRAAALWCAAVNPALTEGRVREAVSYADRAVALLTGTGTIVATPALAPARILLAEALVVRGRVAEGQRLFDEERDFLDGLDPLDDAEDLAMVGLTRLWLDQPDRARATLTAVTEATRRAGALGPLSRALVFTAMLRHTTGDWLIGYAEADEALRLARELRDVSTTGLALVVLGRYAASLGRLTEADIHLAEAARIAGPSGVAGLTVFHGSALGLRHLAAGDAADAVASLEAVREFADRSGAQNPVMASWSADLVEAYRLTGDLDRAREQLEALERSSTLPSVCAAVAAQRGALTTDPDEAEIWFRQALDGYAHQPFARARATFAHGELLTRHGLHTRATPLLVDAMSTFRRLGAEPFCARTAALLSAAGERPNPDPALVLASLTPRELQVARAVADGLSNPEAAAALFVSRKTVETHLSSAYRKLGVRSRTQLVRYLAGTGISGSSPTAERPAEVSGFQHPRDLPEATVRRSRRR
ncbi:helix-turn-helix transcriptional regulator [Winogradskya humida]|uniref:Helix-turn-helix transcriptional regulator n=1 Tax=Winogradskya humida TaxID=113566 RepID=A0ABQ3ZVJ5_9ACTN|nr:LuxR family transcriptional regulator [Actinoplanes humidus]GIE22192.1 helix-turn-helix transcriptional regulator [Actinoplanes humidus]